MLKKSLLLHFLFVNLAFSQKELALIPQPSELKVKEGNFVLNENTKILLTHPEFKNEVDLFNQFLKSSYGFELQITTNSKSPINTIEIQKDNSNTESLDKYKLNISPSQIQIASKGNIGIFYAFQTLQQLLPIQKSNNINISSVEIKDQPKYTWRGMHLDCARHFFPTAFVKKYIDYLAMYKFNTFHWHLTDDQGWRIEIKKYPKLTEVGAWRNGSMVGHYSDQKFDDKRYGGFYTQEEIKEIVAYATARHITVVPEIEMPGHAVAALAAYPEYSCTGGPFEVGKIWGVLDDVFCAKDETFTFLENILSEVISLFPSQYIHIGGDECPKTRWKVCPHCQKRMKDENLKDEHELQSYFIQRIEKFVNNKGKKIIGWDEILEGGLAPNAAVMSWRGTEGGIAAAKQKHFVVMTPGSHCYFDYYQGEPKNEPIAIGGYITVEKVYSFNPTPKELTPEEAKYILGAQANLWTEYIETPKHVEYMIFPRMLALSEVLWGTSNPDKYSDFQNRMIQHFDILEAKGINYSKSIFEVTTKIKPSTTGKGVLFELKSANNSNKIRYTTDGSNPTANAIPYSNPIEITKSQTIKAAYFENEKQKSASVEQKFTFNKATGKKTTLVHPPHENYSIGGALTLVDGVSANRSKLGKDWLGFSGKDVIATIDLGKKESINKISISTLASEGSWIHYPKSIEILVSTDGKNFQNLKQISSEEIKSAKGELAITINNTKTQFIKIIALNTGKIPEGMAGAGSNAWLFMDEIGVE